MIKQLILVGLGGGLGSIFRYLTSWWINKYYHFGFPFATFTINILGCFLIGLLFSLSERHTSLDEGFKLLLIVGFCGGYTTFSAFSLENMKLMETGNYLTLFLYITLSVIVGCLALLSGNILSKI